MRSWIWITIGVVSTLLLLFMIGFFLLVKTMGVNNEGSTVLAANWREELQLIETVEVAEADPTIDVVHFENGDWLIGKCQDSHGTWHAGGGTLVIKDSNGEIRSFLGGHICGSNFLAWGFHDSSVVSLEQFYQEVINRDFRCIETITSGNENALKQ